MRSAAVKSSGGYLLAVFSALMDMAWGQYGTVSLPSTLADPGATVQTAVPVKPQRITYCEGPVTDRNGNLFFSEQSAGIIWKVTPGGVTTRWLTLSPAYVNGMDFAPDGYLTVCEQTRITERDTNGTLVKTVTSGTTWGQGANDLTFAANGDMYFTAFNQHFWYHKADSSVNTDYNYTSPSNINFNGIEYIEEKNIIYLCQWGQNRVVKYNVLANRAVDTAGRTTFVTVNGPDGITVDSLYNVYIASNNAATGAVYVYDSSGAQLGSITMRQDNNPSSNASNCVFGGTDNKTLYITGDSGAYKVQLKVAGRVRPGATAVGKGSPEHLNPAAASGFSVSRSGNGLRIISRSKSAAVFSIYTCSGRRQGEFSVPSGHSFCWRPPVQGTFIVFMSSEGAAVAEKTVYYR